MEDFLVSENSRRTKQCDEYHIFSHFLHFFTLFCEKIATASTIQPKIMYIIAMRLTLLKEIATILFGILEKSKEERCDIQWVTTSNLHPNNVLAKYESDLSFEPTEALSVKDGDILVRRIAPSYVNYLQEASPCGYIANNLIIIRATKRVDSKYLAYYLDKNITKIIKKAAKGTTLPTLTRQDLGEFEIILPNEKIQHIVGSLWFLEIEKIKLQEQLRDLENKKLHYLLNECIKKTEEQQ